MGVLSVSGFKTEPGRLVDHMAASEEAVGHLRRLGLAAMALQTVAGSDAGTMLTVINYADNAAYANGLQTILADEQWGEFWTRAASGGSAQQVEASLFADIDAGFQPDSDRPLGVIMTTQWRAKPGRLMDFMGNVMDSIPHIERLGGAVRTMQSIVGAHPMTTMVSTAFADLDAYGAYTDAVAGDDQFQEFWAGILTDPTADIVRTAVLLNVSD